MNDKKTQVRDSIEIARTDNGKPAHKPGDFGIAELVK